MKKFWIVMNATPRPNRHGHVPYRHVSRGDADREAKRLSSKFNECFVVLESVAAYRQPTPEAESVPLE